MDRSLIGATISHYRILSKIGEGGMGTVYKTEDTRLHRIVALKFLSADYTADSETKQRFIREARTASALDHSNICIIYDIDETEDGHLFIAMAHYSGSTLKDRLQQGPLPVQQAVEYTVQIAEGLAAAHSHGIIHRDLKPANIFITEENVVKILDFGVAKLTGAPELTRNGVLLGTTHYMAPEQLTGQTVDQRADIWALGVIFYEMLTGKQPFDAETDQAIMYAILEKEVPSVRDNHPEIPSYLESLINKILSKDPKLRYQDTRSFINEMTSAHENSSSFNTIPDLGSISAPVLKTRTIGIVVSFFVLCCLIILFGTNRFLSQDTESFAIQPIRIAVMPFENRGPAEQEYFAAGITEELVSRLNSIHAIDVIAQYSTNQYLETQKSYQEIGHELGISYVVTGSIFCYDSVHIRIIPRITRVKDGVQIWSHQYDEQVTNLLLLQSSIAERIFHKVGATLHPAEQVHIASTMTNNFDAYRWYLQGVSHFFENSTGKYQLQQTLECYQKAIRFDPDFALAYAKIAEVHTRLYHFGHDRSAARIEAAKNMVDRALDLAPSLPEAHMAKGWYYYHIYRDYETALTEYRLASEQYPRNPDILFATAAVSRRQGHFEKALELFQESFSLDPRNPRIPKEIGITLSHLRRYDEALQYIDLALQIDPDYKPAYDQKVWMWWMGKGSARETREWVYNAPRMKPGDYRWLRFYQEFYEHDYKAALARLDSIRQSNKEDSRWFETANVYKALGEHTKALAAFDSARHRLEGLIPERDSDYGIHLSLAEAYAGLGWKNKAYQELALVRQNQTLARDSLLVNHFRRQKAQIHLLLGEYDQALNILASQLQKRTNFSIQWVLLNPNWKPIWDHPRFLELVCEYNIGNTFAFRNP